MWHCEAPSEAGGGDAVGERLGKAEWIIKDLEIRQGSGLAAALPAPPEERIKPLFFIVNDPSYEIGS